LQPLTPLGGGKISSPYFFAISSTRGLNAPISSKNPSKPSDVMVDIRWLDKISSLDMGTHICEYGQPYYYEDDD
jgi:hypothetical protein